MRKAIGSRMTFTTEELSVIKRALVLMRAQLDVMQILMPQVFTVEFQIRRFEKELEKHKTRL